MIVIPARMKSKRFYGKPLYKINGKEMILHCVDNAMKYTDNVMVATPDMEILEFVGSKGVRAYLTSGRNKTGTDEVAELAKEYDSDFYINLQCDEPNISWDDIRRIAICKQMFYNEVVGAYCQHKAKSKDDVSVEVKNGYMQSMTRHGNSPYTQKGMYAFTRDELEKYYEYGAKNLEKQESIEILRFKDLRMPIRMVEIEYSQDINREEDLKK